MLKKKKKKKVMEMTFPRAVVEASPAASALHHLEPLHTCSLCLLLLAGVEPMAFMRAFLK